MIDFIYNLLAAIGYTHPLHPPFTHIPMGMTIGAFLFILASFKREELEKTAFYCLILALIFAPVVSILGLMDWQHRYLGAWRPLIIAKMILAVVFIILLALAVYLRYKEKAGKKALILVYALCLATATALGYIGGQLVFG
ncbi:MAG: hypothetical protein A2W19_15735 [Spirochaetes bacterium RBG_16_49_21]|nr:MAG: hypothetical protein A2W19_15735 [Spirochaetes bacterium RBG_16_49_21]